MALIKIKFRKGKRSSGTHLIEAVCIGDFGVHPSLLHIRKLNDPDVMNKRKFTVTHVPTGAALFYGNTQELCLKFITEITKLDWSALNKHLENRKPINNYSMFSFKAAKDLIDTNAIRRIYNKYQIAKKKEE